VRGDVSVLAVGEAHAQKGTEGVPSATARFTEVLLPLIANDTGDVVVELWAPDPSCQKEVKEVARAQKPVVEAQSAENKNEYVSLGTKAKSLGVTPWLLRPTCDDFSALADAGADAIPAMLGLVRKLTEEKVKRLTTKNAGARKMTVAYGGAMHNDVEPTAEMAAYSFGPDLVRATGGAYVELDLIVPEYVKKTPVWEKLPWFGAWERDGAASAEARLYTIAHGEGQPVSYVLIFPATPANLADR
jgi:hypothetical protein